MRLALLTVSDRICKWNEVNDPREELYLRKNPPTQRNNKRDEPTCALLLLPTEVLVLILSNLSAADLTNLSILNTTLLGRELPGCSYWVVIVISSSVSDSDHVWKLQYEALFGNPPAAVHPERGWRTEFISRYARDPGACEDYFLAFAENYFRCVFCFVDSAKHNQAHRITIMRHKRGGHFCKYVGGRLMVVVDTKKVLDERVMDWANAITEAAPARSHILMDNADSAMQGNKTAEIRAVFSCKKGGQSWRRVMPNILPMCFL